MYFLKILFLSFVVSLSAEASKFEYQMLIGKLTDLNGDLVRASFRVSVPPVTGSTGPAKNPTHAVTENNYFDGSIRLFRVFGVDGDGGREFLPILLEATITVEGETKKVYFRVDDEEKLVSKHKNLRSEAYSLEIKEKG